MENGETRILDIADSTETLRKLGYDVIVIEEQGRRPPETNVLFRDLLPELEKGDERTCRLAYMKMYKHQYEAYTSLRKGYNVILTAKTGSGKTEAWAIYSLKDRVRTLAIYPTLALSSDQISRLESYYGALNLSDKVLKLDRPTIAEEGERSLRERLQEALLVISNPAFIMADVKRIAMEVRGGRRAFLTRFLENVGLIVLDEIDFYDSRSGGLLLALIEIISKHIAQKPPQIAILTATLANPQDIADFLTQITGRKTVIIEGEPFHPKNKTIIVQAKNLNSLWEKVKKNKYLIEDETILSYIEDYDLFKKHVYEIVDYLKAKNVELPYPHFDISEILSAITMQKEDGITLVFTQSIKQADKLYRELKNKLGPIAEDLVGVHHHLVPKDQRKILEERARKGEIKTIITVRTLAQGIDLGYVTRIIHIGLPGDLRLFRQREGRKGRRANIPFTESIIIPSSKWDRKLLEQGVEGLIEWINLPLENLYINPENDYITLFKGLWKIYAGLELDKKEYKLLNRMKLIEKTRTLFSEIYQPTKRAKKVWNYLNFYEFSPPYGIPRVLVENSSKKPLEEVSHRDLVEKFQAGSFDLGNDAIVVKVLERMVVEEPIINALRNYEFLAEAVQQYIYIKYHWDEEPNILSDINAGKISSIIELLVSPPRNGFDKIIIEPHRVTWRIESRTPKIIRTDKKIRTTYRYDKIIVNTNTSGHYEDYTYGYLYELEPGANADNIRLGLASLIVFLRLLEDYRLPLQTLRYVVVSIGTIKYFILWEDSASGFLPSVNWSDVEEKISNMREHKLFEPLLWAVDYDAAQLYALEGYTWEDVRRLVKDVLYYLKGTRIISLKELGLDKEVIELKKPSRELGILGLGVATLNINDEYHIVVSFYDGEENTFVQSDIRGVDSRASISLKMTETLNKYYMEKEWILAFIGDEEELNKIARTNILLRSFFNELRGRGKFIDVLHELRKTLKTSKPIALGDLAEIFGIASKTKISYILNKITRELQKTKMEKQRLYDLLKEYSLIKAKTAYYTYLLLREIGKSKEH